MHQAPANTADGTGRPDAAGGAGPGAGDHLRTGGGGPGPRITDRELARATEVLDDVTRVWSRTVVGQQHLRASLLVTLMTRGHILLESVPGLAKTTAASTLAQAVRASFSRVQCTPDLLPSDIIGTQVFDARTGSFTTQLGPVHANFVLLDEINRSSAKTQSAMLEAMQERQTSIGGVMHRVPDPFMVLATQNPIEEEGTYVLAHAQLDRFMLKEVIHYPHPDEELEVLHRIDTGALDDHVTVSGVVDTAEVRFLQDLTARVYVDPAIKRYIVAIIGATRTPAAVIDPDLARYVEFGASPRGTIALQQVARALALLDGRSFVVPEDVQHLKDAVLRHRLILGFEAIADRVPPELIIDRIFRAIPTP